jgi:hypothetical protein
MLMIEPFAGILDLRWSLWLLKLFATLVLCAGRVDPNKYGG